MMKVYAKYTPAKVPSVRLRLKKWAYRKTRLCLVPHLVWGHFPLILFNTICALMRMLHALKEADSREGIYVILMCEQAAKLTERNDAIMEIKVRDVDSGAVKALNHEARKQNVSRN